MPKNIKEKENSDNEQTFVSHLIELRKRLLQSLFCILCIFFVLFYFANDLYSWLASPLMQRISTNGTMIATEVASPFLAPLKLSFYLSIFLAMPFILFQAWAFIAPGLYRNEKHFALPLLISSIILFYAGMAFAFFIIFPLLFGFLTAVAPEGVTIMTDISRYLDFVLKLFFAFGLAFEVPIATILLIWTGLVSVTSLKRNRPYIIVGAFIVGMLLTPPDIISQILLALPIWILFELGLLFSQKFLPHEDTTKSKIISDEK